MDRLVWARRSRARSRPKERVVAVAARASDKLEGVATDIGGLAIGVDLSAADGPQEAVDRAVAQLGGLDALLVNMGGPPPGTFADVTDEQWQRAIDMTLWSTIRLLRAALPHLRESQVGGSICVILSSSVREPIPALTTSNLLRPGLVGLIKSLVPEIAPVRINGIAPGRVATGRIATLDEGRARAAQHECRAGPAADDRAHSAGPLRRTGRSRPRRRVPAFAGRVLCHRRDRSR